MNKRKRSRQASGPRRAALKHAKLLKLRVLRLQRAMSIYDVAERLGISAVQVSRIETGAADTTVRRLAQFAELYGISMRELFTEGFPADEVATQRPPRRKA